MNDKMLVIFRELTEDDNNKRLLITVWHRDSTAG